MLPSDSLQALCTIILHLFPIFASEFPTELQMNHLRIMLCCLLPFAAIAQREDLSRSIHMPFFLKKVERHQRWLDTTCLGTALRVGKVKFKIDKYTCEPGFTELECADQFKKGLVKFRSKP